MPFLLLLQSFTSLCLLLPSSRHKRLLQLFLLLLCLLPLLLQSRLPFRLCLFPHHLDLHCCLPLLLFLQLFLPCRLLLLPLLLFLLFLVLLAPSFRRVLPRAHLLRLQACQQIPLILPGFHLAHPSRIHHLLGKPLDRLSQDLISSSDHVRVYHTHRGCLLLLPPPLCLRLLPLPFRCRCLLFGCLFFTSPLPSPPLNS